jgi:CRP/FNR family transcriptional regulator, cyclic AMP receptor protein
MARCSPRPQTPPQTDTVRIAAMVGRGNSKLAVLKAVPLFAGLNKRELAAVGQIADELDLPAGKELIREGSLGSQFFILLDGEAVVRRRGRKLNTLHGGDFFGEIALLTKREATATVTTASEARVLVVTRAGFGRLLREAPKIQWAVIQALVKRVPADETLAAS